MRRALHFRPGWPCKEGFPHAAQRGPGNGSDLAVVNIRLLADQDQIPRKDPRVYHRITGAPKREIRGGIRRNVRGAVVVFNCEDRITAGDLAQDRNAAGRRDLLQIRLEVVRDRDGGIEPDQPQNVAVKHLSKFFQMMIRNTLRLTQLPF